MLQARGPLVVGLTCDPRRLIVLRQNRLRVMNESNHTEYVDLECVTQEITAARRLFASRGWPVIDVSRRSVEETAASILQLLARRRVQEA